MTLWPRRADAQRTAKLCGHWEEHSLGRAPMPSAELALCGCRRKCKAFGCPGRRTGAAQRLGLMGGDRRCCVSRCPLCLGIVRPPLIARDPLHGRRHAQVDRLSLRQRVSAASLGFRERAICGGSSSLQGFAHTVPVLVSTASQMWSAELGSVFARQCASWASFR